MGKEKKSIRNMHCFDFLRGIFEGKGIFREF